MKNAVNWFEIPARNMDRAVTFYSKVLNITLHRTDFMGVPHGIFPSEEPGVGGAVIKSDVSPSTSGTLIYLDATGNLDGALALIEASGGKIVLPKTHIGEQGYIAIIVDTEGNRIGLHSPN